MPVRRVDLDVAQVVQATADGFAARRLTVVSRSRSTRSSGVRARIDGDRIRQALSNLIDNALHHTPSGGRVSVDVDRADRRDR